MHTVPPPLIAVPRVTTINPGPGTTPVDLKVELVGNPAGVTFDCAIGPSRAILSAGALVLKGIARGQRVIMTFGAFQDLSARLYGRQRFVPDEPVILSRMFASTNRVFSNGAETTTQPNALHETHFR